jgi:hypothetical protein
MLNIKIIQEIEKKKDPKPHELVKFVTHVNRSEALQIKKKSLETHFPLN